MTIRTTLMGGAAALALSAAAFTATPANAQDMAYFQGWYGGIQAGYGDAGFNGLFLNDDSLILRGSDADGVTGGLYLGFNHERNGYVYGIEADIVFADLDSSSSSANTSASGVASMADGVDLLASLRGRLGYKVHDNALVYATAGIAFIDADHTVSTDSFGPPNSGSFSLDSVAFVLGGGAEWAINDTYGLRIQGLYYFTDEREGTSPPLVNDPGDFGEQDGVFTIMVGLTANLSNLFGPQ